MQQEKSKFELLREKSILAILDNQVKQLYNILPRAFCVQGNVL